ncbi:MAG: PGF-pre-PGF domain-containing protein, partial [Hadesarchaea archaeon]
AGNVEGAPADADVWCDVDTAAPSVPTGLTVTDETGAEGSLVISWNAVGEDVQGYQLWFSSNGTDYTLESDQAGTPYTDMSLTDGQTYWYKVSAYDEVPNYSDNCTAVSGSPIDDLAPSIPTGLTVTDETGAEGSLVISWNAVGEDVQGYQLWFSSNGTDYTLETDQAGTTYTDTGLTDGQIYYYKVSAYDEAPNFSDNCVIVSGVPVDDLAPSVLTGLSVATKAGAEGTLVVTWTAPPEGDLQGYKLWFSENNSVWTLEADLGLVTSYENSGLIDGENYFYKISAKDEVPNWSDNCAPVEGIPQDQKTPSAPTGLTVTSVETGENLDLSWTAPPELDLAGYNIYRSTISGGPYSLIATVGVITSYRDNGLTTGTTYYYVISASDEVPNYSDNCTEASGTPTIGVPSSSVNEITSYYQTSMSFTITVIASAAAENVTLYYRYASDNDNWGPWTSFGVDTESSWSWSFTADNGDGYYEFYSIATGIAGQESTPAEADTRCGVDTVPPTITSVLINGGNDLTPSTLVTLTIAASNAISGLAEMRFSDDNLSWSDWENFAASISFTLPTGDGLKTVYVQVKDKAGLPSTVASDSITLETTPPPPKGALTATIGTITAGTTGSADFTRYAIAVTKVRITAAGTVSNVRVNVVVHATKPAGVTAIALPVYSYLDITTNVGAAEVREATIGFKVSRSWITQNSIDERTIRLLRYGGEWQALSTSLVGTDSTHVYFEATTPGFSLFAVTGERRAVPPVVTPPTAPTPPPAPLPAPPAVPLEFFAMLSMVGALAGFSIAYSLARPSKYYLMLKRLERAMLRPRRRRVGEPAVRPPVRVRKRVSRAELAALRRLERIARKRKRKVMREGRKKSASERRR